MANTPEPTLTPGKIVEGPIPTGDAEPVKELRLALVCYGGVSLAIYMHGITKEVHKLVQASAAFEQDQANNPFAGTDTARTYWQVLRLLHEDGAALFEGPHDPTQAQKRHLRDKTRTRVVVDIIAGTSAGGINGICLAKAIACNLSQEPLKTLWLDRGDIAGLLSGPRRVPGWAKALWFVLKSPVTVLLRRDTPPLRGDDMCQWLHGAFTEMDGSGRVVPGVNSLVPTGESLNLFVPITDFHGYRREFPIEDPKYVRDRTHRHVLEFRHNETTGENFFSSEYNHVLAFAARATSSFPGAFPPIGFRDYSRNFPADPKLREVGQSLFREYALAGEDPSVTQFIDGGVLDNYPFDSAIRTIPLKPAVCQVDRRLLYIEPDPEGGPPDTERRVGQNPAELKQAPTWLGTIWGGIASIPRNEPIIDDLRMLASRNEAVARVRDVIELSFASVQARVLAFFQKTAGVSTLAEVIQAVNEYDDIHSAALRLEQIAAEEAGFSYATYLRLRARSLVDSYADAIGRFRNYPAGSNDLAFVRAVIRLWLIGERGVASAEAGSEPLFSIAAVRRAVVRPTAYSTTEQQTFLSDVDIWYHERRVRFMIAALNWWYRDRDLPSTGEVPPPSRASLDATKKRLYAYLQALDDLVNAVPEQRTAAACLDELFNDDELRNAALNQDAAAFIKRHRDALAALTGQIRFGNRVRQLESALYRDLTNLCADWDPLTQAALLVRYLGFPFWDILVFPIEAISAVGERDSVETIRMSPRDVGLLAVPVAPDRGSVLERLGALFRAKQDPGCQRPLKLRGTALAHFWAFFQREARENDYLWGRLDAAERLIALLLDDPSRPGLDTIQDSTRADLWRRHSQQAFAQILDEEQPGLSHVKGLIDDLERQVVTLQSKREAF